ncbi:MAG: FGGY family carbohydrate kinase, partial [Kofleriaceae bacterium]
MRHVIAIDQGTTGSTVLVLDEQLAVRGRGYKEFRQIYPRPGWVEHDPEEIWSSVLDALAQALNGTAGSGTAGSGTAGRIDAAPIDAASIAAIGITNQRETAILWDRKTGQAAHNAIVWQDRRTAERCAELKAQGKEARVKELTGLTIDPYFSGTKVQWMLHAVDGLAAKARTGDLAFGTVDAYLLWRLTGGAVHATDVTNASRTLVFDIAKLAWSDELCELIGVPRQLLPQVVPSSGPIGTTRGVAGLPDGIQIAGI